MQWGLISTLQLIAMRQRSQCGMDVPKRAPDSFLDLGTVILSED